MCGVSDADCRHYHRKVDHKCVFDLTKVPLIHISNPPNWGGRRGKWSENRQRKSSGEEPTYGSRLRQLRIARYNYALRRHFKRPWQGELTVNPRNVRWAIRKRQSL